MLQYTQEWFCFFNELIQYHSSLTSVLKACLILRMCFTYKCSIQKEKIKDHTKLIPKRRGKEKKSDRHIEVSYSIKSLWLILFIGGAVVQRVQIKMVL